MFDHAHDIDPINDLTENHVLVVQEWCCRGCDEKLAAIRVGARVLITKLAGSLPDEGSNTHGHAEETWAIMLQRKILVVELRAAIDSATSGSISVDKISSLNHEVLDLGNI